MVDLSSRLYLASWSIAALVLGVGCSNQGGSSSSAGTSGSSRGRSASAAATGAAATGAAAGGTGQGGSSSGAAASTGAGQVTGAAGGSTGSRAQSSGSTGGRGSSSGGGCLCPASTPLCTDAGACAACFSDSDCGGDAGPTPHCDPSPNSPLYRTCVGCVTASQCPPGTPVCDAVQGVCATDCRADAGPCPAVAPLCNQTSGACVQCFGYADCVQGELCRSGSCTFCQFNTDCFPDAGGTICGGEGLCGACQSSGECANDPRGNVCTPIGTCGQCASAADCDGGLCTAQYVCQ